MQELWSFAPLPYCLLAQSMLIGSFSYKISLALALVLQQTCCSGRSCARQARSHTWRAGMTTS